MTRCWREMDSNFRFPDAPSGRSAEARTFSSDRGFAPLAWREGDFESPAPWISALERGRFQGHKQKRKLKSVAPFARNRKFESISLQPSNRESVSRAFRGPHVVQKPDMLGGAPRHSRRQEPTKYSLIINLKIAKALGLTVPPSMLDPPTR